MEKSDIKVGLKFRAKGDNISYGVITEVKNNNVYFHWTCGDGFRTDGLMKVGEVVDCFDYYGWTVLSALEQELL
jgi:hypothetical protein